METTYFCGQEEHTHADVCYTDELKEELICALTEHEAHTHGEGCYGTAAHTHQAACFNDVHMLDCGMKDGQEEQVLTCTKDELVDHIHAEGCYDSEGQLTCQLPEFRSHTHGQECYRSETVQVLSCTLHEHTHNELCRPDPNADLETAELWEATMASVTKTENRGETAKALAETQIGYAESARNFISDDGVTKQGYTRYGAWYGAPYGAWDSMFVSFVLHYAGVAESEVPRGSDTAVWKDELQQKGLLTGFENGQPKEGSPLFYTDETDCLRSGIIYVVDTEGEGVVTQLRVIAGDVSDSVSEVKVKTEDVVGWIELDTARPDASTDEEQAEEIEPADEQVRQTAETENYLVTVTYPAALALPEGSRLRVTEYAKDSETFRKRCEEAGYELEWLLNIGFYVGEEELELNGAFNVVVTPKQGGAAATDITHFTDDGAQHINGVAEGETAVSFETDGFSDFGGGVARAAVDTSNQVRPDLPTAVTTGTVNVEALRFYNLCESGTGIGPLAGCVFEITGTNGYYLQLVSGDTAEVMLPQNMPNGT